jgi:hypothetical protein
MTLYEATENMRLLGLHFLNGTPRVGHRKATSQLFGVVRGGTLLCPGPQDCHINATGSSDVDMATGLGTLTGKVTVVVQGDNPIDSPESVVARGRFHGKIDFSPTFLAGRPCGTVTADLVVSGRGSVPFIGTFRQPVGPSPAVAFYVAGECLATAPSPSDFTKVNPNEYSFSFPGVRFEIIFGSP